jgi:hypothetical protein
MLDARGCLIGWSGVHQVVSSYMNKVQCHSAKNMLNSPSLNRSNERNCILEWVYSTGSGSALPVLYTHSPTSEENLYEHFQSQHL